MQVGRVWNRLAVTASLLAISCSLQCHPVRADDVWDMPDETEGRLHFLHPSPRCCHAADCLQKDKGRYAIVTSIRTPQYMIFLKELHCSLQKHHAYIPFIVISVAGDLGPDDIEEIMKFAEYREVEDLYFPNYDNARYALNWMKLRVWGMDEYDAVLMIDSDITVHQDLTHLFHLPTDFAWASDQGANWTWNSGGFIFLRPCKAVMEHMIDLASNDVRLQFQNETAEQSFWAWYFRYSGMRLPMIYNANWHILEESGGITVGGDEAAVVHFAYGPTKPFNITPASREWKYFCYRPQQWADAQQAVIARELLDPLRLPKIPLQSKHRSLQSAAPGFSSRLRDAVTSGWHLWAGKAAR